MGEHNEKTSILICRGYNMHSLDTTKRHLPLLIFGGLAVGLLGGLLGAGGGILAVFVLGKVLHDTDADGKDIFANTVAIIIPLCIFSLINYASKGAIPFREASPLTLPALIGGALGGWLLDKLKVDAVRTLFGILILISGILMLLGR